MSLRIGAAVVALGLLVTGCKGDGEPAAAPSSAPVTASVTPTAKPKPTVPPKPTPSPSASKPATPTPSPTPSPKPTVAPGVVLTAKGAYLEASEDENLTQPDPENGCAVHDPDLDDVECGVVSMAGGVATWITGREQHKLPGADEPRLTVRLYRRLANGSDSLVYAGFGDPGTWAEVSVRTGSLTGQVRDSLVVVVTFRGSGTLAGYDVVTWRSGTAGPKLAAHHPEGSHAQIYVRTKGYISTYEADYSDGSPNCCPKSWKHDNVYWSGGVFRLRTFPNVSSPPSG
ncbi:MAG TPA: hypothetical protein VFQ85_01750 [Mycobacteriales bacterium]|jgi:hypothetical protein|nr:hypothetical protein [Mycobacteriales bacterium]